MQKAYRATSQTSDVSVDENALVYGVRLTDSLEQAFRDEGHLHSKNQRAVYSYEGTLWDINAISSATTENLLAGNSTVVARLQVLKSLILNHDVSGADLKEQVRRLIETQLGLKQASEFTKRTAANMLVELDNVFAKAEFVGKLDKPRNRVIVATVPDPSELLDFEAVLSEQKRPVLDALISDGIYSTTMTGRELYLRLSLKDLCPAPKKETFETLEEANKAFLHAQAEHTRCNGKRMNLRPVLNRVDRDGIGYELTFCTFLSKQSDPAHIKRQAASNYLASLGVKGTSAQSTQIARTITIFDEQDVQIVRVMSSDYDHTPKVQLQEVNASQSLAPRP